MWLFLTVLCMLPRISLIKSLHAYFVTLIFRGRLNTENTQPVAALLRCGLHCIISSGTFTPNGSEWVLTYVRTHVRCTVR